MKNKKLMGLILVLTLITLIMVHINKENMEGYNENNGITFISGEYEADLSFEEITALHQKEFRATEDTSSSGPNQRKYKGVVLFDAMKEAGIGEKEIIASSKIIVKGLDGYVIALSPEEVLTDKIYLAFEKDGKLLGNMQNGGSGPFQLIAISDFFSQRWCKYVFEVIVE